MKEETHMIKKENWKKENFRLNQWTNEMFTTVLRYLYRWYIDAMSPYKMEILHY